MRDFKGCWISHGNIRILKLPSLNRAKTLSANVTPACRKKNSPTSSFMRRNAFSDCRCSASLPLTQYSNRSRPTPVSAVGKRDFAGQRQRPRNGPSNSIGRLQRQNACTNRRQFGAIRSEPGKPPFAQDCLVGLGGLELPTKRLSAASSEH